MKRKSLFSIITTILTIVFCFSVFTSCNENQTLENLANEYGIVVDGGGFKEGSILVSKVIDITSKEAENVLESIQDQDYDKDGELYIYDISVFLNDIEVQPKGNVKVTLPAPNELISKYIVFHVKSESCEKLSAAYEDGKISFETSSFSYFVVATEEEKEKVNFLAQCEPFEGGYITENGVSVDFGNGRQVEPNTQITLTAVANEGYEFKGWGTRNDEWSLNIISTEETHTFTVTENTYVQAVFEMNEQKPINTYRFLLSVRGSGEIYNSNNEIVSDMYVNGVTFDENTEIKLKAVANENYEFKGWYNEIGDSLISTEETYTFKIKKDILAYALFEEKVMYNFLAQCEPSEGGHITENGVSVDFGNGRQVEPNTQITLTAVANEGYEFKGWGTRDEEWSLNIISTEETYTFTVTEKTYVQAVFEEKVNGLKFDAHNAGFTYNENDELIETVYTIGNENKPNAEYVLVYATYPTQDDKYLTLNEDYTIDLGGLDFTKAGTYTITYVYKKDTSIRATISVQVVEKPADGSLTEAEWTEAMSYWASQTNVKVVSSYSSKDDGDLGAQIMIYQFNGTAFSEDGGFENDPVDYKGKASYIVKDGDTYSTFNCWDNENWYKQTDEYVKNNYEWSIENQIYACRDYYGNKIDFSYANYSFDTTTKTYKNSDGSITIALAFDNDVLTKIVVTVVLDDEGDIRTNVNTITFGDAVVVVPTDFIEG